MPRILVIDDDRITRRVIETALTTLGYQVVTAGSGEEGLKLVKAEQPDIVLTDKMMPGIDGFEVTRRLRREPDFARLPILVLTSESELKDKLDAFEAGADDYLSKPFEVPELAARLTALLRRAEALKMAQTHGLGTAENAHLIAVQSLRGGIGCSSLAVNLAIGLANLWQMPTMLMDMTLIAGQVALMLNKALKRTWADLAAYSIADLDMEAMKSIINKHDSGLHFIAAPANPTQAEKVSSDLLKKALTLLQPRYEYMVADIPHNFSDTALDVLDTADIIVLLLAPEMAAIRAAAIALDTYAKLGYAPEKIKLALNWTFEQGGLPHKKIEAALHHPISLVLPFAPTRFVSAINRGAPLLHSHPEDPVSALIEDFAFRTSREAHQGIPPAAPSPAWRRVNERLHRHDTGQRKQASQRRQKSRLSLA